MQEKFMREAILEAEKARKADEVPIGCVIVKNGKIIARGHNLREKKQDATLHAEIVAIRKACRKVKSWRLTDCQLYVTIEPCPMCAGAIVNSRIPYVYYGSPDLRAGACDTLYGITNDIRLNHRAEVTGGILGEECAKILTDYFCEKRKNKKSNTR